MGSSSGSDYSTPPQQPAPPANLISPMGQSTPYQPNYINFLGDPGVPSTGLTPDMLAAINASNGPPPGAIPAPAAAAAQPAAPAGPTAADIARQRLAEAFMQQNPGMQNFEREKMMKDGGFGGGGGRWAEGGGYGGGGLGSSNRGGGGLGMRGGGY